jgi:hypothetical protein
MERPGDACPYRKPFPEDFKECPAFQPRQFIPLDTLYHPLEPVITCRHLETRLLRPRYRWYAACGIGDASARERWAIDVGPARLERIRALQFKLATVMAPFNRGLWEGKGRQLEALRDSRDASKETARLRQLGSEAITALGGFLESHRQEFEAVEIPITAATELIRLAVDRFIATQYSSEISFEVPDDVLQRFPPAVRGFFRPSAVTAETGSEL